MNHLTRRCFLARTTAAGVAACGWGCLNQASFGKETALQYEIVPNWPTLPEDLVMAGANGVSVDSEGRVYAAAGEDDAVLIFSPEGKFLGSWGSGVIEAKHELRIYGDKVYVCDTEVHQVYEFTLDGKLLRSFGTRGKAGLGKNEFDQPTDIAFAANGDIYITDGYGNSRVVCLSPDGEFKFAWGEHGTNPGQFHYPHNIVIDKKQNIYIADRGNNRIQVFDLKGTFLKQWRGLGKPFGLFLTPDEKLFVSDGNPDGAHRILILDLEGRILAAFGSKGSEPGQFDTPHSLVVDKEGNLYVSEVNNKRVDKFVPQR